MATPNFSVTQNSGTPSYLNFTDTSTALVGVAARRIYLLQADGTYLVPTGVTLDYILWAYASSTISTNVLTQDAALSVKVDWVDGSGVVLYTLTVAYGFSAYNETFYYGLSQTQSLISSPNVMLSTNYYQNKLLLRVLLDSASQAINYASDIYSASVCYDSATYLSSNENLFF